MIKIVRFVPVLTFVVFAACAPPPDAKPEIATFVKAVNDISAAMQPGIDKQIATEDAAAVELSIRAGEAPYTLSGCTAAAAHKIGTDSTGCGLETNLDRLPRDTITATDAKLLLDAVKIYATALSGLAESDAPVRTADASKRILTGMAGLSSALPGKPLATEAGKLKDQAGNARVIVGNLAEAARTASLRNQVARSEPAIADALSELAAYSDKVIDPAPVQARARLSAANKAQREAASKGPVALRQAAANVKAAYTAYIDAAGKSPVVAIDRARTAYHAIVVQLDPAP